MSKGALVIALGLFTVCLPLAAQQAKHSGAAQHRVAASAVMPLDAVSNLSIYRPNVINASNSILFHNGPVRAWSDGAQLVSESAFVQIGMAPLGLFPVAYLAPSDAGPTSIRKPSAASNYRSANLATDGKDLPAEMLSSPLKSSVLHRGSRVRVRPMERQRTAAITWGVMFGARPATINSRSMPAPRSRTGAATHRKFARIHFRDSGATALKAATRWIVLSSRR